MKLLHELQVHHLELEMQNEELRRTQLELDASRARYFDLYELGPMGYFTLSQRGLILEANLTAASMLGVNRDCLIKRPLSAFILKEDQDCFYLQRKRLVDSGEPQSCELRMVRQDGSRLWVNLRGNITPGDNGVPLFRVVITDISDRKQAEEALANSLQLLERTGRLAKVGGWELDLRTMAVSWSLGTFHIHEVDPPIVPPLEEALAFYPPEARPTVQAALKAAADHGTPWDLELPLITAKGRRIWTRSLGAAELDQGQPIRLFGTIQDLTESIKIQEKLRESEERYRTQFDLASEGIVTLSPNGKFIEVNEAFARTHGYTRNEMMNIDLVDLISPRSTLMPTDRMQRILSGEALTFEVEHFHKDGHVFPMEISAGLIYSKGKPFVLAFHRDLTPRKRTEAALRESSQRFQDIAQASGDWIWEIDAKGHYTFASDTVQALLGYKPQEILGKSPFDLMSPEEASRVSAIFTGIAMRKENFRGLENTVLHRDGTQRHVLTTGVAILGEGGELLGYRGLDKDITAQKQVDAYREMGREVLQILNEPGALRESLQRVLHVLKTRTGFDAVGIRLQDGEDFPYFAQEGFPPSFLRTENTLVARTSLGGLCRGEDGNACLECTCGLVLAGKTDPSMALFTPGGSAWTSDSAPILDIPPGDDPRLHPRNQCIHSGFASIALVPILNQDRVVGLIQFNDRRKGCFALELVELLEGIAMHLGAAIMRKQAEEVLRESEERYRVRSDYSPEAVLVYDFDAKALVDANPNAERILGLTREEILGGDLTAFFAEVQPDHFPASESLTHHFNLALGGQETTFERMIQGGKGRSRQCEVRLVRLPSEDRRLIQVSYRDITDRRQNALLVGEMKSLAAKGNVAAYIAHEINNPLAGIRNSFQLVARAIPKEHPHYPFTKTITKELDRIANIVRTIYSLYRPNPLPAREIVLDETLSEVIQLLGTLAKNREVSLELKPSRPAIRGLIPEDLLRQALFNLLQNAIDATPPGGRVFCSGKIAGTELIVQVEDSGPGVSPELAKVIFQPGFSTKKAIELSGLGLGLDTCRKLMDAVGGSINFENRDPGPGAIFSLHFPWNNS